MKIIRQLRRLEEIKNKEKDRLLVELSEIDSAILKVRDAIKRLESELSRMDIATGNLRTFGEIKSNFDQLSYVMKEEKRLKEELANLERKREETVQKLLILERERKIIKKLKERKEEEVKMELLKREIKKLDEIGVLRWRNER
mgnify:CR=1 FL=1